MKRFSKLTLAAMMAAQAWTATAQHDSVFIYSPDERSGLHAALKEDGRWQHVGQLCGSDYGPWGSEKRMYHPSLCRGLDGSWLLVFQVNDHAPVLAASCSKDLVSWRPQDYHQVTVGPCLEPVVRLEGGRPVVYYRSDEGIRALLCSDDLRSASPDVPRPVAGVPLWRRDVACVEGERREGQKFALGQDEAEALRTHFERQTLDARLCEERLYDDARRLSALPQQVNATLTVDLSREKAISDRLIGIFFEDISYAADGGLYAELVQNCDFEYTARDHRGWTATAAWHSPAPIETGTDHPLSARNPHYAIVRDDSLWNEGWDGIAVEAGQLYDFSMYVRGSKKFTVKLIDADGKTIATSVGSLRRAAETSASATGLIPTSAAIARADGWVKVEGVLRATATTAKGRLLLLPKGRRAAAIDMVSLFPRETFMGRKNGLRKDLAETIAALKPRFVRFPGGCMSHGQGLDNIYHWQHTIGALQDRQPDFNIWHYHQTRGLGFLEYFQFCEDIGAEPLPVLAAGVPCQNSAADSRDVAGQQGGIPMEQMPAYIDELCNLIDWANADPATNEWARLRAEAGHPEPFGLKYLGIGNEDIISTVFEERYGMICEALRQRHPEIQLCGTVGPFHAPSADYVEGWDYARRHDSLFHMVDEHYYESTGWFLHHRDYYDAYPRSGPRVYLGEWAASTRVKRPNVETALAEALYLTDIERNADVVAMTSYAPLLCKDGHANWNPDMIYFSNTGVRTTPAYEVQRLFSLGSGDRYVSTRLDTDDPALAYRVGASLVRDSRTGRRYLKLVNALPATLHVDVRGMQLPEGAACMQLSGAVDDQQAKAVPVEQGSPTTLPPYSVRLITL